MIWSILAFGSLALFLAETEGMDTNRPAAQIVYFVPPPGPPSPETTRLNTVFNYISQYSDPCNGISLGTNQEEKAAAFKACQDVGEAFVGLSAPYKEPCPDAHGAGCESIDRSAGLHRCIVYSRSSGGGLLRSLSGASSTKKNSLRFCGSVVMGKPRSSWEKGEKTDKSTPAELNPRPRRKNTELFGDR